MTYKIYFADNSFKQLKIGQKEDKTLASRREFQNKIDCIIYAKELAESNNLIFKM